MACQNIVETYREYKSKKLAEGYSQRAIDSKWAETLLVKRTGQRRQWIEKILEHEDKNRESLDIAVKYNNGKSKTGKFLDIKEVDGQWIVSLDSGTYTFNKNSTVSQKTSKGMSIRIPVLALISDKQMMGAELDDKMDGAEKYRKLEEDVLKDPRRALEVFDELIELDGTEIDEEYKKVLRDRLEMYVSGDMIPNVTLKLNKKALQNNGTFTIAEDLESAEIAIGVSPRVRNASNSQSAAEKYVHEIGHAISEFAIRLNEPEAADAKRRLMKLREKVRTSMSKAEFIEALKPEVSINSKEEQRLAENIYKYVFENGKTGLSEFLVLATTNKELMEVLKKIRVNERDEVVEHANIMEQIVHWMRVLLDTVTLKVRKETVDTRADELAVKLIMELGKANNKAARRQDKFNPYKVLQSVVDKLEAPIVGKIDELTGKINAKDLPEPLKEGATRLEKAKYVATILGRSVSDAKLRPVVELMMSGLGMKPEGIIQAWANKVRDSDTLDAIVEQFGLESQKIDQRRTTVTAALEIDLVESFKEKPTTEQMNAMTLAMLDTDLSVLDFSQDRLAKMLASDEALKIEIKNARKAVKDLAKDKSTENYYIAQAHGLGYYMATHTSGIAQMLNAKNIAIGMNRVERDYEVSEATIEAIDRLATLEAVRYTEMDQRELAAGLVENEWIGVQNLLKTHAAFKEESNKKLFNQNEALRIKGYTKEIFNDEVTLEIAPILKIKEMEKAGFTLIEQLEKAEGDTSTEIMGIYRSTDHMTQAYNRDALRLTDWNRRGTTLTEVRVKGGEEKSKRKAKLDVARLELKAMEMVAEQEKGQLSFDKKEEIDGLSPVLNKRGEIVDFRYMMSKAKKRSLLDQEIRGPKVLASMHGSIVDKVESKVHNKKLVELIKKDMEDNYKAGSIIGKNGREYVVIEEDSPKAVIRDIYRVLPKDVKEEFKKMGTVAVRRDQLYSYFGFRDMTLAEMPGVKMLPKTVKHVIRVAEEMWQALVSISKVDIVIRTPMVLIGNIMSNFIYSVQMGENPVEVAKLQLKAVRDLREYIDMTRELIRLEVAQKAGNPKKLDIGKIESLRENLKNSPVVELMDAGMFQAIIEDVSLNEFKSSNKWTRLVNSKIEGAPQVVKTGLNYLYMTEATKPFKLLTTATQYSDFAARYAQYHLMRKKGVKKEVALKSVLDAFINYNGNDRASKYLNDMGLVMFTKYFQRIQRVIRNQASRHPVYGMLALLGQEFISGDLDDITDQSMFIKDLSVMGYDPIDHIMRALRPTGYEWVEATADWAL